MKSPFDYLKELGVLAVVQAKQVLVHLQQVERGQFIVTKTAPISVWQGSSEPIGSRRGSVVTTSYYFSQISCLLKKISGDFLLILKTPLPPGL